MSFSWGILNANVAGNRLGGGNAGTQPLGGLIGGTGNRNSWSGMEGGNDRGMFRTILRKVPVYNDSSLQRNKRIITAQPSGEDITRKNKLFAIQKTYNDSKFGGDNSHGAYTAIMRVRRH
jgi:hypothetical protein